MIERLGIGGDGAEAIEQLRGGGSKSGKPYDRLTAPYLLEMRVMRRMTESVNVADAVGGVLSCRSFRAFAVGQVYSSMKPVGVARNGLENSFQNS